MAHAPLGYFLLRECKTVGCYLGMHPSMMIELVKTRISRSGAPYLMPLIWRGSKVTLITSLSPLTRIPPTVSGDLLTDGSR